MQYNLQTFSKLSLNVVETLLQHYIVSWVDCVHIIYYIYMYIHDEFTN